MTEWHRVVFSDESRFCLSSDSRRVRVWRRRGERSNPAAIVERPTVRQRGIMVWGAIAYDSRSPLLRIQGTMTAQRYVDDVLRPVTLPYLQGVPNALYQQDNARPHTARINQQALQDVQMLPWPPYSPDLSPIEHVWDIIGRRLHALPQPRSEDELWQMVEREWRAIPQDAIRTLIDSLPRRVAACIAVRESELDETQYEDYSKAKDDIFNMLVSIEEALSLIETKENTHSDKQLPESNVNLPKINLPIFNGDSANWLSFREIFNSTINSNQTLTEIQKFQYLNASVKGIRNLSVLGLEKNTLTDLILINFFLKIGEALRKEWELTLQNEEYPTFENFVNFLEKHARSLQEMLISTNTICNVMPLETETNILLSTALIKVKAKDGSFVLCRALVDNGSQICLISEQCCHKLGLEKMKNSYTLKGVGDIVVNRTTSQSICGWEGNCRPSKLPNSVSRLSSFRKFALGRPEFYVTKPIDLILGADTFVEIILGHKTDLKHHPIALNTKLGWLVSGRIHSNIKSNTSVINHCTTELDSSIRKFWELEDVPISKAQLGTKNACEILFKSNLKRDIEGRYSVNLPFKSRKRKTSWDEPIESDIKSNWNKFQTQLSCLKEIKIPRYLNSSSSEIEELQLQGFCDASLNAYSAVFYLKTRFKIQKIKIILITSKTKVCTIKYHYNSKT
ncbi:hypothetical protein LAZ67_2000352 [Cordylochernes scorpioides]|uniref:Tc1-like transposase DDE domain-containing protein n=1 Tax=Cordylochernes scorpioides TaxID=51811 RepID=A0ABY6K256_9ARAC|nr:hypothetical protein LAZ67_2000352 [Cordylochernes scorpioides]